MLVPPKTVNVAREDVGDGGQAVQILAVDALWTDAARKKEAEVRAGRPVCFGVATVLCDVAAALCSRLAQILILAVAAAPFVVPDVEDSTSRGRRLSFECRRVDLRAGGAALATDDLLDFLALGVCGDDGLLGRDWGEFGRCGRRGLERDIGSVLLGLRSLRGWGLNFGHGLYVSC